MIGPRISRNCRNCWRVLLAHDTTEVLLELMASTAAQPTACFGRVPGVALAAWLLIVRITIRNRIHFVGSALAQLATS
jgi:hypothetical protein